jgi:hypothetical protein
VLELEPCLPDDPERELDRELDSVRLPGVPSDLLDGSVLVARPNLVAAVAAERLVTGHIAADTSDVRLDGR